MVAISAWLGIVLALEAGGLDAINDRPPPIQPIYGGSAVDPGDWPSVVAIEVGSQLCTGTLITPRLVMTAAHCLVTSPPNTKVHVQFGDHSVQPAFETTAGSYGLHPDFCADAETCKSDLFDFAYVVLKDPAPADFPPATIMTTQDQWDDLMRIDAAVILVGFGKDENWVSGIKREAETVLTRFSDTGLEFQAGGMGIDSCQGDSGGPAFMFDKDGDPLLVGVLSRGYACGEGGFYGIPSSVLCWISDESGIDVRPSGCETCDCLDPDPDRSGCDRCAVDSTRPLDALAVLLPLGIAFAGRRRRRRP